MSRRWEVDPWMASKNSTSVYLFLFIKQRTLSENRVQVDDIKLAFKSVVAW